MIALPGWVDSLAETWAPVARLGGNEWAESERELSAKESPQRHGRWVSLPFQRQILDDLADPSVDWIVARKPGQIGFSELVRCAIGRWMLLDPGDVLWVMGTEHAAKKAMKRLRWMFESTPSLRPLLSKRKRDSTLLELSLTNGHRVVIGWAGSADSLASEPFRYVILDEVAKYAWSAQGEGSPVGLANVRTKTFGRLKKVVLLSTPKDSSDILCTEFEKVLWRGQFHIPCPHCEALQAMDWSQVRWEGGDPASAPREIRERMLLANRVQQRRGAVWLECVECGGRIDERARRAAMESDRAQWVPEPVGEDGCEFGRARAYQLNDFLHWEQTLGTIAAEFLKAMEPESKQIFWNSTLGLPMEEVSGKLTPGVFMERRHFPARVVPSWATGLILTADTQADHFKFKLCAWGRAYRRRLVHHGRVESFEELKALLDELWALDDGSDRVVQAEILGIDAGGGGQAEEEGDETRTGEVYEFAATDPERIWPLKGMKRGLGATVRERKLVYKPSGNAVVQRQIDGHYWKDQIMRRIQQTHPFVLWEENEAIDRAYCREMTAEHKVLIPGKGSEWQKKGRWTDNDYWDCDVYQAALASVLGVADRDTFGEQRQEWREVDYEEGEEPGGWVDVGDDWLD